MRTTADERPRRRLTTRRLSATSVPARPTLTCVRSRHTGADFSDNWCRFDFFLVCSSLVDQFATELLAQVLPLPPMLLRVLRVLRILRILRLLKGAKQLRDLIVTMILSFPSLLNVGSLLCLNPDDRPTAEQALQHPWIATDPYGPGAVSDSLAT